ncbi:efflux RND transporter periplasmic adaptor subunit [Pelagicoccus sp. SDUM812002]|uniref:efflux RND transporter periplasmic adaptor subunit n=1 Tax=Pelagicoccus sp. SDUM812002 TaxID=3041266 RepID=UPI00280C8DC6|nr:efflux RND transporter periplasmic adaptor subunit [Pelagicoccus sp. SDUM812002]MDQ8184169.1 efflux RND transporter periplasmic adaptor subunit [Pelagicoccus sp. SDUM812002]
MKRNFLIGISCLLAQQLSIAAADPNLIILDESGVRNLGIQTVEAEERNFESTVFSIGRIEEIPESRSVLSSRIPGRVVDLNVFEGDTVSEGQILARVESRQLGNPPPTIELRAPQLGLVVNSHVRLGQPVEPDSELLDISDRSRMWAVAKIPEQEAAQVDIGSQAHIRIPALGGEVIEATLYRFGVDADRQAGAVEGIFELDNAEGRLRPGMRAEFSIVLKTRELVMSIPRESVQGDPTNRIVFVKDFDLPNAFVKAPVILGEQNDRFVEVVAGLFPGDEVVTRGSYSLAFAGSGSGMSLKEALDAAHGHEHNEDGSELTPEQKAARQSEAAGAHDHDHHEGEMGWLLYYAIAITLLCVFLGQKLLGRRQKEKE